MNFYVFVTFSKSNLVFCICGLLHRLEILCCCRKYSRTAEIWAVHVHGVEHRKNITKVNIAKRVNPKKGNENEIDRNDVRFQFRHIQNTETEVENAVPNRGNLFYFRCVTYRGGARNIIIIIVFFVSALCRSAVLLINQISSLISCTLGNVRYRCRQEVVVQIPLKYQSDARKMDVEKWTKSNDWLKWNDKDVKRKQNRRYNCTHTYCI